MMPSVKRTYNNEVDTRTFTYNRNIRTRTYITIVQSPHHQPVMRLMMARLKVLTGSWVRAEGKASRCTVQVLACENSAFQH